MSNGPVIDLHLHCYVEIEPEVPVDFAQRPESAALLSPASAEEHRDRTLAEMDRHDVVRALVSGSEKAVRQWHEAAPGRFIGGIGLGEDGLPEASAAEFENLVNEGVMGVLGELGLQYRGISPADDRLTDYYDFLERSGVPLALHTGLGPPGGPHTFAPRFRVTLGRPTLLEPVMAVRPGLKAWLMHAGWPYLEDTLAMLYMYPGLYVDIGVLAWALPEKVFHDCLERLVDTGFEDRVLFGTDQMIWPESIGIAVRTVQETPFLTNEQRRAILYDNAVRFLGFTTT